MDSDHSNTKNQMTKSNGIRDDKTKLRVDNSINPFSNDILKNLTIRQIIQVSKNSITIDHLEAHVI